MNNNGHPSRDELYTAATNEFGRALDRLAFGYEANAEKRLDLRQEIHLQLWRSLAIFDGRCSLKTWTFRVAHNAAVSYINRERRNGATLVSLEDFERTLSSAEWEYEIDHRRDLERLTRLILQLKPLDRQIMISYLEELDNVTIAEITGLSPGNVAMKIHRIKYILSRRLMKEERHA